MSSTEPILQNILDPRTKSCCDTVTNQKKMAVFSNKIDFICVHKITEDRKRNRKCEEKLHKENILFIAPKHLNMLILVSHDV